MEIPEIIKALRKNMVETGSLICIGCGREHNCSTHGCAIMKEAADALEEPICRAESENKAQENSVVVQRAMKEIKKEHCGDYDCLLPDNKLDDSGYWVNDAACKDCTYGACYRALECLLHTTAPENKSLTLEQLKQMDNQPVWTEKRCGVVRADPQITRRPGMPVIHFNYGWEWADDVLACGPIYARKPEGSEHP